MSKGRDKAVHGGKRSWPLHIRKDAWTLIIQETQTKSTEIPVLTYQKDSPPPKKPPEFDNTPLLGTL